MTICQYTGMACNCQPDEGFPCDGLSTLKRGFHEWRHAALKAQAERDALAKVLARLKAGEIPVYRIDAELAKEKL